VAADTIGTVKAFLGMKQVKLQQDVQVDILKKIMNQEKQAAREMLETMPPVSPSLSHLGNNLDIYI